MSIDIVPTDTAYTFTDSRWPNLRSRVVADSDPQRPEDDGAMPIIALRHNAMGWVAEPIDLTCGGGWGWTEAYYALRAAARFGSDLDKLERYLRIFHGCTAIDYLSDQDGTIYIACDPAEWREHVGAPEGADLGEWRDYLNDDVYGVVVEKLVTWAEVGGTREQQTWDEQDSLWGLYGWKYALETGELMLLEAGRALEAEAGA